MLHICHKDVLMADKPKILIVDDEPITLEILEGHLIRDGYDIIFASGGVEAIEKLEQTEPDVILLDIMMPDMDGYAVCQRLKSDKRWQNIPIILVTALSDKRDLARGLEAGADDFINKPVHNIELRARVKSMLRIKKQYDSLQSTLQLREDMAHMIVHDMRTPLNVVSGLCEWMLTRASTSPENLNDIKKIQSQTQYMNEFLNDMLILAKMEADQLLLTPIPTDVNRLLSKVVDSHTIIAQSKNINFVANLPENPPLLELDISLLQRALDNLVSNALKFSPDGSTVTVQLNYLTNSQKPTLRIRVIDEGPGVPAEYRERIFEKFETAPMQRTDLSQIGLGLTFCKMVVEAHRGQISVEDNLPAGSVFTIEI